MNEALVRARRLESGEATPPHWGWWKGSVRGPLSVKPDGVGCGPIWVPFREINRAVVHLVDEVPFVPGVPIVLRLHTPGSVHDFYMQRDVFERAALPLQPEEVRSKILPRGARIIVVLAVLTVAIVTVMLRLVSGK
jgi:hypothetical protein